MIGSSAQRQQRVRVLTELDRVIKQFRRQDELWPLRAPANPVLLEEVVDRALPDQGRSFDLSTLRARSLLQLEWDDGSLWHAWVVVLPSGFKVYGDTSDEETRILASGGRNEGDASDRLFLQMLCESAGGHFGIEMTGGAPVRVQSAIPDREFLLDCFVNLLETTGAEASVLRQIGDDPRGARRAPTWDFRRDVERWLDRALAAAPSAKAR